MLLVIEPINHRGHAGFHLNTMAQGAAVVEAVGRDRLGLQFDLYHCQVTEGDVTKRMEALMPYIAHMQIADVPARHEPGTGEIGWDYVFPRIDALGYRGWVGCEYRPAARHGRRARLAAAFRRLSAQQGRGRTAMKIGFIGLGIMGAPMALNLRKAGHELYVPDRHSLTQEMRAEMTSVLADPAAVAEASEVIVLMVPDTPDVERVLFGAHGVARGPAPGQAGDRHVLDRADGDQGLRPPRGRAWLRLPPTRRSRGARWAPRPRR